MRSYLLDTHAWAWAIKFDRQLPRRVAELVIDADAINVSAISFYEITQKVGLGKWPEMEAYVGDLSRVLSDQGGNLIDVTGAIAQFAGLLEWHHRDPFDRMIAATAITMKLPLISVDTAFDELSDRSDWPGRVW